MGKKKKILLLCVVLMSLFSIAIIGTAIQKNKYDIKVIEPTCEQNGYSIYTNKKDGTTKIENIVKAKGHKFSEWENLVEATYYEPGQRKRTCQVCGEMENETYYIYANIPHLNLYGDLNGIGKKDEVPLEAKFVSKEISFNSYARLKYQGHSSLKYDKKNFTIKFYNDDTYQTKKKIKFSDWNEEYKYILKANYIDTSRIRNLLCAEIWSEMVKTREVMHKRLKETSNYGSIDGFPTAVYLNDEFLGLYNTTLHKEDKLYAMQDGKKDGILIINESSTDAAFFRDKVDWKTTEDWEIEYCGTEDKKWLENKLNNFIDFVANSSDEEFKTELNNYLDVNSAIDYMIAMYALGLTSNYSKDLILITYDDEKFIASLFDMENAFGLYEDGSKFYETTEFMPNYSDEKWKSNTESVLWDRIINSFNKEIKIRYKELRKNILSEKNIKEKTQGLTGNIPTELQKMDFMLYPNQPQQAVAHDEQIILYFNERIKLLDKIFNE